jgi:methylenetetrahydrofolate dehydrogenase (NADP+)/methenyltetrahydrofolate cyclohydrolase
MTGATVTSATTRLLRGAPLRDRLLVQARAAVAALPRPPLLAIVQVGQRAASAAYIRQKMLAAARVGIAAEHVQLRAEDGERALHATLKALAENPDVTAVIPQLPLPDGWNADAAVNAVPALKDCDGLTAANRQKRLAGDPAALAAATPLGVLRLLAFAGVAVKGAQAAVIGRGRVVGAPLREMLAAAGAEVLGIDKDTPQPQAIARRADIVCAAAGVPGLVDARWLRPGAVVIDIGLTRCKVRGASFEVELKGDVDAEHVMGIAGILTPVPGGVGPLTVASLLTNVVDSAYLQAGLSRQSWTV